MGETIAENLTKQGVNSSASEGLTTLVNKVLNIQIGGTITLTTNKSILSHVESESATLTATYSKGAGHSLEVYNATTGTKIGDMTDNNDGTYSYTYNSANVGDISMTAIDGAIESNSISIEDIYYYNDGTKLTGLTISSGVSVTVEDGALRITTSTSGEKAVTYPVTLTNNDNYILEWELAKFGTDQHIACWLNNSSTASGLWMGYATNHDYWDGGLTGTYFGTSPRISISVGDKIRIQRLNGVITVTHNNTTIISKTTDFPSSSYQFGNYTNQGRVQYLKNIKVKKSNG